MPSQTVEIRSRQVSRQLIITTELLNRFFNHTIAAKNRLWHSDIWMGRSPRCIEFGGYERTFYEYIFFSIFHYSLSTLPSPAFRYRRCCGLGRRTFVRPTVARIHGGRMERGMARTAPDLVALCGHHQFATVRFHARSTIIALRRPRYRTFSQVRVTTSDDLRAVYDNRWFFFRFSKQLLSSDFFSTRGKTREYYWISCKRTIHGDHDFPLVPTNAYTSTRRRLRLL